MQIGDTVIIAANDSIFDCCQGKRGRIAHRGVGGGWLLCTDHFCPIERSEEELTLVTREQLAREVIEASPENAVRSYRKIDSETLEKASRGGDRLASAILVERASPLSY